MGRILVIDDDVELCSLVGEYLEPEGFGVEFVYDGERGLERALSGEHPLVVLDVMLPGMNGLEVLRRTQGGEKSGDARIPEVQHVGDIELDPATRVVRQQGKPVELTSVEFNLLQVLLREAGRVVTRERLVDEVLSRKFSPFDRSIDMHVSKLRKKLGDSEGGLDHIKTVRGVGYIFTHPREQARSGTQ